MHTLAEPASAPSRSRSARFVLTACCLAGLAAPALAQDQTPLESAEPDRGKLRAEVNAWYVAPAGDVRLPGTPASGNGLELELGELEADSPRLSPYAEAEVSFGDWRLGFGGFGFSGEYETGAELTSQLGDVPFSTGNRLRTSVDFASAQLTGGYAIYRFESSPRSPGEGVEFASEIELRAGARLYDVELEFENLTAGSSADADELFIEPIAGVRWTMDVTRRAEAEVTSTVGYGPWGDRTSLSFEIAAGFAFYPLDNVGIQVGYRLLGFDLQSGDSPEEFEWNGAMAGVLAGVVLRF